VIQPALWGGVAPTASAEVDEEFEAVLDEYDDGLLGAMEDEPHGLEGGDCIDDYDEVLDDFLERPIAMKAKIKQGLDAHLNESDGDEEFEAANEEEEFKVGHAQRTLALVDDEEEDLSDSELASRFDKVTVEEDKFDCESILSLRSNTSNHPGRITRPDKEKKKHKKEELPPLEEEEVVELPEVSTLRSRGETAEDRKARKAAVKEHQRLCRSMKKETKALFSVSSSSASPVSSSSSSSASLVSFSSFSSFFSSSPFSVSRYGGRSRANERGASRTPAHR